MRSGVYRDTLDGQNIDTVGEVVGTDFDGPVASTVELASHLSESEIAAECFAHRMLSLAQARALSKSSCGLEEIATSFAAHDNNFSQLIEEIAASRVFSRRSQVKY